ncbi:MAG: hypothetical protein ACYTET_03935 [Planctomycetota bacterium]|jgi:hypothetical protein
MKRHLSLLTIIFLAIVTTCPAVTSLITRHKSSADFQKGTPDQVIVDSTGTLKLAPNTTQLDFGGLLADIWSIHTMFIDKDGALYLGTGPDGKVIRYANDEATVVYPENDSDAEKVEDDSAILNQHVFALGKDIAGRLLVGISGQDAGLVRLTKQGPQTVFEDERVQYIFAIAMDAENNIYLATGPEGLIFKLNPFCREPEVLYDAVDKNILSLTVADGFVYAGSDGRGLVYKIDPTSKAASVLYDAEQDEITALSVDGQGNVYVAATNAAAAIQQLKASETIFKDAPGRPDNEAAAGDSIEATSLNTANTSKEKEAKKAAPRPESPKPPAAKAASHVYKIDAEGFVTDLFAEMAVFYTLQNFNNKLWLGTGNRGQLFTIDPVTEEKAIVYQNDTSLQVTSTFAVDDQLYLGLSNPAEMIQLSPGYTAQGTFESTMIDAGQPAQWGKLQIEADIPDGCSVLLAARSGNVNEPNDSTLSDWSGDVEITQATDLNCPLGRFCQYRLTLKTDDDGATPVIRQVAAAHVVPNLAPTVNAIKIQRSRDKKTPFGYDIGFAANDHNKDVLEFELQFRKQGRTRWIQLKDELDTNRFMWDGRTVEDGRYEVRVIANDRISNSPETMLTGSRISDPVVIDNTAPDIVESKLDPAGDTVVLYLSVADAFSVIGKVEYTVNSNEKWMSTLPDDLIYDTLDEQFTIRLDDLESGEHVIAVKISDDLKNIRYKTFEVTIP